MLLGRDRERRVLDGVLATARGGESAVCALVGEPGIGKTALLDDLAARCDGMRLLRARGVESEAEVPFGGLLELLRPELALLPRLPAPQAAALGGALALQPGGARDRFTVGAATLSLLAAAAEQAPLAILVDDVQWLDGASAEALLFALRRLLGDPIGVVLAARDGEPSLLDGAALPTLRLEGLDRDASAALVVRGAAAAVADDVVERLYTSTGGNPLALQELAADAPQLAGTPAETPLAVTARVVSAFGGRIRALPTATQRALLVAAVADGGDVATVARAGARLGLDARRPRPRGGERRGRRRRSGRRPSATPSCARRCTRPPQPPTGARRTAPSPTCCPTATPTAAPGTSRPRPSGPDDAAAAALAAAAGRARERGAHPVAASAYERAARLASDDGRRAELLHEAGDAAWAAGLAQRAEALLEEAAGGADPQLSVAVDHLRGRVAVRRGRVPEGVALLVDAAERAAPHDPARAVAILAEASNACYYGADMARMLAAAERACELLPEGDEGEAASLAALAHGMALVLSGGGPAAAVEIRRGLALIQSTDVRTHPTLLAFTAAGCAWLRDETSHALAERVLEQARAETAVGILPVLLLPVARIHAAGGEVGRAQAEYHEAIGLAREAGQLTDLAMLLAGLAGLEARQGRDRECREHAAEARSVASTGMHELWALAALGTLELGLGNAPAAVAFLEDLDALLAERVVGDADLWPGPELVEAYLRLGRADDAARVAEAYDARARAKGLPWALAGAARCRAQLAPDDEIDARFAEALALHARAPDLFATAWTNLAYGARLRRARRRSDARDAAACGARRLRAPRSRPLGRHGAGGARRHGRDGAPAGAVDARPAHAAGAADRPAAGRRAHDARGRGRALPQPEDDRVPPAQRLPEAGRAVARGAGGGDGRGALRSPGTRCVRRAFQGRCGTGATRRPGRRGGGGDRPRPCCARTSRRRRRRPSRRWRSSRAPRTSSSRARWSTCGGGATWTTVRARRGASRRSPCTRTGRSRSRRRRGSWCSSSSRRSTASGSRR